MNLEKLIFTKHANAQMTARGIMRPTVLATINNGESEPVKGAAVRYCLFGFFVVVDGFKVVTVYGG